MGQKPKNFEEALEELEGITRKLESSEISLEEALKLYERGIELKNYCEKKLSEAEHRWAILQKNSGGEVELRPIDSSKIPELNEFSQNLFTQQSNSEPH